MNIILGILVLMFAFYMYKDVSHYNGLNREFNKAQGYGVVLLSLIIGLGLIFDMIQLW